MKIIVTQPNSTSCLWLFFFVQNLKRWESRVSCNCFAWCLVSFHVRILRGFEQKNVVFFDFFLILPEISFAGRGHCSFFFVCCEWPKITFTDLRNDYSPLTHILWKDQSCSFQNIFFSRLILRSPETAWECWQDKKRVLSKSRFVHL